MNLLKRSQSRDERGAATVEFALILPLLVVLVFGIIQFSLAYNRQQGLHAAAREGARIASLPQTTRDEIRGRVNDALEGVPFESPPTINITPNTTKPCGDQPSSQPVRTVVVEVEGVTQLDVPLWGNQSITLTGRGEFRCE